MRFSKTVTLIDAHAEGEIGRVLTGGITDIPGATMIEKLQYLNEENDDFRRFVVNEPRGCAQMTTNVLLPPCNPKATIGFIPMQGDASHAMSGSNAICVTTVVLETGMVEMTYPESTIVLDTAAGLVTAKASCNDGKVTSVSLDFFPTFCEAIDVPLDVDGIGTISVDIAFGGVYYVLVPVTELGRKIEPNQASILVEMGEKIKQAAQAQIHVHHPDIPEFDHIEFVMFTDDEDGVLKNATIMPPGRMDRSPCGTGSAARLACLYKRRLCQINQPITMTSIIGTTFQTKITEAVDVANYGGVRSRISGRAWIFGLHQIGRHPTDPFPEGFTMGDTWGNGIQHRIPTL